MVELNPQIVQMIALIRSEDLAAAWGYSGATGSFRDFCNKMGIKPIPGRPGWYDPRHVRHRMDAMQGMLPTPAASAASMSLVEQRRARNGTL